VISRAMADITKQFALRLPDELVEAVDLRASALGISRNQWYENMTRWVLVNTYTKDGMIARTEK
jgi:predicted HicB family RNase H-like nuclease